MAGFFKSLFRSRPKQQESQLSKPTPSTVPPLIEQMSFDDVIAYTHSFKGSISTRESSSLLQRLYTIALYEHHVPNEHRKAALTLAAGLTADWEQAFSNNPEAIAAIKLANNYMVEDARRFGIGSLAWKIGEESISAANIVPYVTRPEHRHLLPDFLSCFDKETITQSKKEYVRQIILSEQYEGNNAVLILHGLAAKGDKAVAALFTPEEYKALLAVPNNYDAGRRILVALGLLPETSSARPFKPIAETQAVMAHVLGHRKADTESDTRLKNILEDEKTALLIALDLLRIHLAHGNLRQIYGEEAADLLIEIFTTPMVKENTERFEETSEALVTMPPGTPIDLGLLDSVLEICDITTQSEDDWNRNQPFLTMGAEWLNQERVGFQCYLRFVLRFISDPAPQIESAADEEIRAFIRETYHYKGAQATLAEKTMYFEDWIGTDG